MKDKLVIMVFAPMVVGCEKSEPGKDDDDDAPHGASRAIETGTYHDGKGVHVPDGIKSSLGIKITEVEEKQLDFELTVPIQAFRTQADTTWATGYISKLDAEKVQLNQEVNVRSKTSNRRFPGTLRSIENRNDSSSGLMAIVIEINSRSNLNFGSPLEAVFSVHRTEPVMAVPSEALITTVEGDFVYVLNGEDFYRTPVRTGAKHDGFVEIEDGLYAGDQVVVQPPMKLWLAELQSIRSGKACADGD